MSWNYNPKDASSALPEGQYPASLEACTEETSKQGNPMLKLVFKVYPSNGGERTIYDYIVNPSTIFKLKGLAKALGRGVDFDNGSFYPGDYIGSNLDLYLTVQEDDVYGDKNQIGKYHPSSLAAKPKPAASNPPAPTARQVGTARPAKVEPAVAEEDIPF